MFATNLKLKLNPVQKAWTLLGASAALIIIVCAIMLFESGKMQSQKQQELISNIEKWASIANASQTVDQNYSAAQTANLTFSATLAAESDTQAASRVQALVRRSLKSAGVEVRRIQPLELNDTGRLSSIGVEVAFNIPANRLNDALRELESTTPRLELDQILIRQASGNRRTQASDESTVLEIKATVRAYIRETSL
ncbi:MAG: type II secretion system protein GspM [Henriciella sp.]|nr:type II secretion system protein GspM [Henriciella sp.]